MEKITTVAKTSAASSTWNINGRNITKKQEETGNISGRKSQTYLFETKRMRKIMKRTNDKQYFVQIKETLFMTLFLKNFRGKKLRPYVTMICNLEGKNSQTCKDCKENE